MTRRGAGRHHDPRNPARPGAVRRPCRRARPIRDLSWRWPRPSRSPKTAAPRRCGSINRAADWPSFRAALRNFVGPMQNIVYADVDGTIGFIAPGLVPIRRKRRGLAAGAGLDRRIRLDRVHPVRRHCRSAINPPSGHFVSANNKIVPDSYPYFLSRDWDLPNRAERIEALLAATPVQTPASSAAIQADTLSLMAQRLVPLMTRHRRARRRLARGDRAAAALGLSHGPGQGRAAAVHRLAARVQPLDPVRPVRRRRVGLLGFAAAGHGGGVDRARRIGATTRSGPARRAAPRGSRMPSQRRSRSCAATTAPI